MTTQTTAPQIVGRDEIGTIAEMDGFRYYLTDCCGASAKGSVANGEPAIVCRACYLPVDERLGGIPAQAPAVNPAEGLATMSALEIVGEIHRAEAAADAAKAAGDRVTERREHDRLVAALDEFDARGFIVDAACTRVGARVQGTATGRFGTVSECRVTGEITVDWGSEQVPGFPGSRYNTFTTAVLATGGLKVAE